MVSLLFRFSIQHDIVLVSFSGLPLVQIQHSARFLVILGLGVLRNVLGVLRNDPGVLRNVLGVLRNILVVLRNVLGVAQFPMCVAQ